MGANSRGFAKVTRCKMRMLKDNKVWVMDQSEERIIGKIIHNNLPIEWMRYNMYSSNNIYKNIPILVFRINESDTWEQLIKLKKCVSDFNGNNKWKVFKDPLSRKGNYLLTLACMEKIRKDCCEKDVIYNEQEYLGSDRYRFCCEQAVQDIPLLAKHIEKCFILN